MTDPDLTWRPLEISDLPAIVDLERECLDADGGLRSMFEPDAVSARYFAAGRPGHWQFDLPGYVAARLLRAGIGRVDDLGLDTYAAPDRFYSFRRATHRGEPAYGRQISLIGLV